MTQDKIRGMLNTPVQKGKPLGLSTTEEQSAETPKHKATGVSDRKRHTVYLSKTLMKAIDTAFKDAAHDLYPQEVEKADYLETCLKYALANVDDIKMLLASEKK
jgi:hypothetical protein